MVVINEQRIADNDQQYGYEIRSFDAELTHLLAPEVMRGFWYRSGRVQRYNVPLEKELGKGEGGDANSQKESESAVPEYTKRRCPLLRV